MNQIKEKIQWKGQLITWKRGFKNFVVVTWLPKGWDAQFTTKPQEGCVGPHIGSLDDIWASDPCAEDEVIEIPTSVLTPSQMGKPSISQLTHSPNTINSLGSILTQNGFSPQPSSTRTVQGWHVKPSTKIDCSVPAPDPHSYRMVVGSIDFGEYLGEDEEISKGRQNSNKYIFFRQTVSRIGGSMHEDKKNWWNEEKTLIPTMMVLDEKTFVNKIGRKVFGKVTYLKVLCNLPEFTKGTNRIFWVDSNWMKLRNENVAYEEDLVLDVKAFLEKKYGKRER